MLFIDKTLFKEEAPKKYVFILRLLLVLKIFGFAAISESGAVNKVMKIGLGLTMTLAVVALTVYMLRRGYQFRTKFRNSLSLFFYLIYLMLGTASIFWAHDYAFAIVQIFRDFDLLVFSILFLRVMQTLNAHHSEAKLQLPMLLAYGIFFNSLYFFGGWLFVPDVFLRLTHGGEVARLGGYIMNPNELGMLSSLGASCVILDFARPKKKFLYIVFLCIGLYVMFLTGSRSSSIGFMLVAGLITLRSDNLKIKLLMAVGFVVLAPIAVNEVILNDEKGGLDEVMSMTGRLPFWKALLTEGLPQEPFFGFGFQNIYYTKYFQGKNTYPASMTHNTFVQVLMNLGLVGAFVVIMQMTTTIRSVIRSKDGQKSFFFWCMFMPPFINSLTEFGIWGETNYGILFYQLMFLWFVVESDEVKEINKPLTTL